MTVVVVVSGWVYRVVLVVAAAVLASTSLMLQPLVTVSFLKVRPLGLALGRFLHQ
jgi:hypothetical protein